MHPYAGGATAFIAMVRVQNAVTNETWPGNTGIARK
jgi:hypothetical protein